MGGKDDPVILAAAKTENRILLTFDLDFADVRHYPPGSHAWIAVFRLHDQRWRSLEKPVTRLLASDLTKLELGLTIVEESRVRYRRPRDKRR